MSFKTKYLESENARLRDENRALLCALLDALGRKEAANMLRGAAIPPPITQAQAIEKAKQEYEAVGVKKDGTVTKPSPMSPAARAWRYLAHMKSQNTKPINEETQERPRDV